MGDKNLAQKSWSIKAISWLKSRIFSPKNLTAILLCHELHSNKCECDACNMT